MTITILQHETQSRIDALTHIIHNWDLYKNEIQIGIWKVGRQKSLQVRPVRSNSDALIISNTTNKVLYIQKEDLRQLDFGLKSLLVEIITSTDADNVINLDRLQRIVKVREDLRYRKFFYHPEYSTEESNENLHLAIVEAFLSAKDVVQKFENSVWKFIEG